MKFVPTFVLTLLLLSAQTDLLSQKFGHINSGNLLSELSETKSAEKELETYQKQLLKPLETEQAAFDEKANLFQKEYAEGKYSQKEAEAKYAVLQKEQEGILKRRQEAEQKLLAKRDELIKPIFTRVEKAIQEVGKEHNFTFIFDTSIFNAILYVEESDDVTPLVKKKLGL